ncbi:MAG: hypothetical protein WCT04_07770 [Planctomycetota bacterium]
MKRKIYRFIPLHYLCFPTPTLSAIFGVMEPVEDILRLDLLLCDLVQQRAELASRPAELDAIECSIRAVNDELRELLVSLSPEDEAWLDVERAGIRHGVSGGDDTE